MEGGRSATSGTATGSSSTVCSILGVENGLVAMGKSGKGKEDLLGRRERDRRGAVRRESGVEPRAGGENTRTSRPITFRDYSTACCYCSESTRGSSRREWRGRGGCSRTRREEVNEGLADWEACRRDCGCFYCSACVVESSSSNPRDERARETSGSK
jgi:hypothetical protein